MQSEQQYVNAESTNAKKSSLFWSRRSKNFCRTQ